jgi:dipeptide/tripeptide permease
MGLIAAIIGLAVAPARAATACVTLGVISVVVLVSYGYRHRQQAAPAAARPVEEAPGPRLTNAQYRALEALWAIILLAAAVATAVTDGGARRAAFSVPTAMAIAALVVLEVRRRQRR